MQLIISRRSNYLSEHDGNFLLHTLKRLSDGCWKEVRVRGCGQLDVEIGDVDVLEEGVAGGV